MNDFWYNPNHTFSYNALLNFVVGARGCGKTYGCKKWAIKHFIKTGKKFIYLRRYKDELKDLDKFFDTLKKDKELKIHSFEVRGRKFYMDGLEIGKADLLSTSQGRKGVEEPDVDTIIFDEFIIEKGFVHYLPNEVNKLIGFMDSIFRNREGCRCICLANSIVWVNPYFIFFKFSPIEKGIQVTQQGQVLLEVYVNEDYKDAKKRSRLGQLIDGTMYSEMAVENKFEDINDDFIQKKDTNSIQVINIVWKDRVYGLWYCPDTYRYVVSNKHNPSMAQICYTTKDFKPNMMLITDKRKNINLELKRAFTYSYLFYEDIYIRNDMFDLFTLMGVR